MDTPPSLVAFGSLANWPVPQQSSLLRQFLLESALLRPIVQSLYDLTTLARALSSKDPTLNTLTIQSAADDLIQWIKDGERANLSKELRNALLMPMTVIAQAVQYLSALQQSNGIEHASVLESVGTKGGIQGFCAGLLTAVALASSTIEDTIGIHVAISVKLAFCIGVYVDLDQDNCGGTYSTLAVRWREPTTLEDVEQLVEGYVDVSHACSKRRMGPARDHILLT